MKSAIENQIPIKFQISGVEFHTELISDSTNPTNLGLSEYPTGTIKLQHIWQGRNVSDTSLQNTFCHELIHMFADANNYDELSKDEKFVQSFANSLFEFLRTAVWSNIDLFKKNSLSPLPQIPPFVENNSVSNPLKFVTEFTLSDDTKVKCSIETNKPMNKNILGDHLKDNLTTVVEGLIHNIKK